MTENKTYQVTWEEKIKVVAEVTAPSEEEALKKHENEEWDNYPDFYTLDNIKDSLEITVVENVFDNFNAD